MWRQARRREHLPRRRRSHGARDRTSLNPPVNRTDRSLARSIEVDSPLQRSEMCSSLHSQMEETLTQDVQTLIDVLRKFGSDLGLPKLDVDQLIKTQRSHLDAFAQATQIAAEGAASIAKKQREVLAAGLREASELAHEYKPLEARRKCWPSKPNSRTRPST